MSLQNGGILDRLLRANEEQAKASGALVELQRQTIMRLDEVQEQARIQNRVLERVVERFERMDIDRQEAVETLKEHVTEAVMGGLSRSEMWWRRSLWIAVGMIALSNIVGVGLDRLVALLK